MLISIVSFIAPVPHSIPIVTAVNVWIDIYCNYFVVDRYRTHALFTALET